MSKIKAKPLNNDLREAIVNTVIRATFADRENELKAAVTAFADRCYAKLIPAQFAAIADSLPSDYFMRPKQIKVSYEENREGRGACRHTLESPLFSLENATHTRRGEYILPLSAARPVPYCMGERFDYHASLSLDGQKAKAGILKEHEGLMKTAELIVKEREQHRERLHGLLASIRTVQHLIEIAPELKPYIPAEAMAERAQLPVPVVGTLITDLMRSGLKLSTVEV